MRALCFLLLLTTSIATTHAAEEFPYTAYVTAEDVHVRSGPGQNYYPTSMLPRGTAVEVYRHDPGGWYAVRPPEGSFSWVSARYLEIGSDGIATVAADRVVARVGSELGDYRDVIQVRLDKGEELELIEERAAAPGQAPAAWYQVAPPSGEFRWIHAKYLDRQRPSASTARRGQRNLLLAKQMKPADDDQGAPSTRRDGPVDREEELSNFRPLADKKPKPVLRELPAAGDLDELDLLLSKMVIEDPDDWRLPDVREQAESFLKAATNKTDRDRAKLFLTKVERFETIQERTLRQSRGTSSMVAQSDSRPAATPFSAVSAPTFAVPAESTQFDGAGQLRTVVSRRPNAPQFALVDETGNVRSFVAAAPGVNLRPYVGQQIGIVGYRGTAPDMNAPLLTARQITPLERTARR